MQDQSDQGPQSPIPQPPDAQGLYDPQHERAACGVGFVVHLKGAAVARHRREGPRAAAQSRASRRLRLRGQHRRRRRHPGPDARSLPAQGHRPARHHAAARSASMAPASCSCRICAAERAEIMARFEAMVRDEGQIVLGWRDVPTDDSTVGESARRAEPDVQAGLHRPWRWPGPRPGAGSLDRRAGRHLLFERKLYVIRKRIEHEIDSARSRRAQAVLRRQPLVADDDVEGHADGGAARRDVPRPRRRRTSSRGSRWSTSASAPTRSRRGRSRTPTA